MVRSANRAQGRIRVLGVEPDPVTRALLALYLEPIEYDVRLVERVSEALPLLQRVHAGMFLCSEHALGKANFVEVEQLRSALNETPVIALAEPDTAEGPMQGWSAVCGRISKPVAADALLAIVEGRLRGRAAGNARPGAIAGARGDEAGSSSAIAAFERFISTVELDAELVEQLVASFLERSPTYLEDIAGGLDEGDMMRVDHAAHTLKGMVGNLHLASLVELSDRLRLASKANDVGAARLALSGLQSAFTEVAAELRRRWPNLPA